MSVPLRFVPLEEIRRVRSGLPDRLARARALAEIVRLNTIYMIKRAGSGHIGTSFSCTDILTWLYLEELDPERDVAFSSKGHDAPALYALLIALERLPFELLHELRRLGGLPGHPDVRTPHVRANTGSLGMGISKGKGMVLANRLRHTPGRVFVLTGDGELQEGQIWESLQGAANARMGELVAIVDRNRIQSDLLVRDTLDYGDLEAKFRSFGWAVVTVDGHDLAALADVFRRLRQPGSQPTVVIAESTKGRGVARMAGMNPADPLYRFHSGAPSDADYAQAVDELLATANRALAQGGLSPLTLQAAAQPAHRAPKAPQALVAAYGRALVRAAERDEKLVVLDADLVLDTGLLAFRERFPERFVECGIAEQDMVSQAGGLALRGFLPVAHSFSCFLSARPNEQIYNNATERTRIVYVGSLAGLVPGGPGHSHQCVRDVSALGAVPGLVLFEPCTEAEVEQAVEWAVFENPESTYLRLVSVKWDVPFRLPADYRIRLGHGSVLLPGQDAAIIAAGPILLSECHEAALRLRREGYSVRLIHLPWLNRVDPEWLRSAVVDVPWVFTVDNHYVHGGQGEMVLAALAELGLDRPPRARRLGLTSVPACGKNEEVLAHHRLDAGSIAQDIAAALGPHVARPEPAR